ncbi:hypothetical protein [Nocardia sp. NPDC058480]|uniref:hypothetical protein n=1 Tax=Nocardia sp. NPDC058480 TaxID=3346522 RepID=UPI0036598E5B
MTETEADHLFLSRSELRTLIEALRTIPAIVRDLAVTIARESRTRPGLDETARVAPKSMPPIDLEAWQAGEDLRNVITSWVRLVCETRGLEVPAVNDLLGAAKWLDHQAIPFAMTEGSDSAWWDITAAIDECRRLIDLPTTADVVIDQDRLRRANNSVLTAYEVEKVAGKLGDLGKGLNRDRVRYLAKKGLKSCGVDGDTSFYRLGDVLAAHQKHGRRGERKADAQ